MHEVAVAQEILRIIETERARHHFDRVITVTLRAGALSCIQEEALRFAFELASEGTCASDARIDLDQPPKIACCSHCEHTMPAEQGPSRCENCGSIDLKLNGSASFEIVSIEVE